MKSGEQAFERILTAIEAGNVHQAIDTLQEIKSRHIEYYGLDRSSIERLEGMVFLACIARQDWANAEAVAQTSIYQLKRSERLQRLASLKQAWQEEQGIRPSSVAQA